MASSASPRRILRVLAGQWSDSGQMRSVRLQSGGPVWNTRVYGKVRLAPVLYQDRLVALTNKGYVYVLQAGNGRAVIGRLVAAGRRAPFLHADDLREAPRAG